MRNDAILLDHHIASRALSWKVLEVWSGRVRTFSPAETVTDLQRDVYVDESGNDETVAAQWANDKAPWTITTSETACANVID